MTKAQDKALIAYPEKLVDATPIAVYPTWIDENEQSRKGFITGYEQAEKDTIVEVERWLRANLHHLSCWNVDDFCVSMRKYLGHD